MGDVTAVNMDVVTESSGHAFTPMAVSVCLTPAAPSPLPIPYPVTSTSTQGVTDPAMRTKIDGAKVITVGSVFTVCHGNEAGTLKEVVSLNTSGPCFIVMGAPTVICELGFMGITNSPGFLNKQVTVGAPGMASGAGGAGAGGGGGDGGGGGGGDGNKSADSNSGSGGGGNSSAASANANGGQSLSPEADAAHGGQTSGPNASQCTEGGHPVDVASGFVVDREIDLRIDGVIPLVWKRSYSSSRRHDARASLGPGWVHTFEQWIAETDRVTVWREGEGREIYFDKLRDGEQVFHRGERATLHKDAQGKYRVFHHATRFTSTFEILREGGRAWLRSITDGYGNVVRFDYDARDRLVRVVDTAGREVHFGWKGERLTTWEVRAGSARAQWGEYKYTRAGCLRAAIDARGHADRYEYDEDARMTAVTLKNGTTFHYEYDDDDRCIKTWGPDGLYALELEYDLEARVTRTRGEEPRVYKWNARGLVERIATPDGTVLVERAYDEDDYLLAEAKGDGAGERFWYDHRGRLVRRCDAAENTTTFEYAGDADAATKKVSPDGHATTYGYDVHGSVVSVEHPTGARRAFTRDERGRLVRVEDSDGERTTFEYDAANNVVAELDSRGERTTYECDVMGRPIAAVDPLGHRSTVVYDALGNVVHRCHADGATTRIAYDPLGKIAQIVDARGRTITFEHAGMGVRTEVRLEDGRRWKLSYTGQERLREVVGPTGQSCSFEYDAAGRIVVERTFDGRVLRYDYDAAGRLARILHPDGTFRLFAYNRLGDLVEETSNDARATYERDRLGRMFVARIEEAGWMHETKLERDVFGRVVAEMQGDAAVRWARDPWNRVVERTLPNGSKTKYERDADGRLTAIDHGGHRITHRHDAMGRATHSDVAGRFAITTGYDARGRRVEQRVSAPRPGDELPAVLVQRQWRRDAQGVVTRVEDARWGVTSYEYDKAGQLLSAERGRLREIFAYDDESSIVQMLETATNGRRRSTGPNWEVSPGGLLQKTSTAKYRYDARARRVGKHAIGDERASVGYRWDGRDRLREVDLDDGSTVRFHYDAFGRRVGKTVVRGDRVQRTVRFVWDGFVVAGEVDSVRGPRWFVHAPGTFTPVFQEQRGEVFTYVNDHVGVPKELIDAHGRVAWAASHTAFGRILETRPDEVPSRGFVVDTPFRLLGQYFDEETGLCHTRHRYFDPEVGRWLSPDPLGLEGGNNLFAFDGSPTRFVDPLGLAHQNEEGGEGRDGRSRAAAREAEIQPGKHHRAGQELSEDEAVDHVRAGGDVIARDQSTARRIAERAGNGPPDHDLPHDDHQLPHYHPTTDGERSGGHVLY